MKLASLLAISIFLTAGCSSQEKVSEKDFDDIALVNKIEFIDPKFDQSKFCCAFLLKYENDTFAVTAKHILKIIKTDKMKSVLLEDAVKQWSMYPLNKKDEMVVTGRLLNENRSESLENKSTFDNDWLLFSVKENNSHVRPLQIRTSPLVPGEKLYVTGWTRKMESGPQRVYEFEYYKTIGNRILLKEIIVPEQFGGLSGAPLLDSKGFVAGIVSNGTVDPESDKKYFSPCTLDGLLSFIKTNKQN